MSGAAVAVEQVACPGCGGTSSAVEAEGPDYLHHVGGSQTFRFVRCRSCALVYLNPRPTLEMLGRIYGESYYTRTFREHGNPIVKRAKARRDRARIDAICTWVDVPREVLRVLDVGAGDGGLLDSFQVAGVPAHQLVGLEIDREACAVVEARGFRSLTGLAESFETQGQTFHIITLIQVVEHLADPCGALRRIAAALEPGGVCVLETPNLNCWERPLVARRRWGGYHFPRHWTLWDRDTLSLRLRQAGLEPVSVTTTAAAINWAWTFNHWLQDWHAPRWMASFFSMQNPLALAIFWAIDFLPARFGVGGNLRVVARKPR